MFPQQDLLPNQFLLPLRLILKTLAGSTEAPADEGADYGCHTPVESIAPVSSFLSLLSHETELEPRERLELVVTSLLLEQCCQALGWQDPPGLALTILRLPPPLTLGGDMIKPYEGTRRE